MRSQRHLMLLLTVSFLHVFPCVPRAQGTLFKFSLVTDIHYQNPDRTISKQRIQDYVNAMAGWGPAFVVQDGDFIQGWYSKEVNLADLASADSALAGLSAPRYNVIGNHEMEDSAWTEEALNVLGMDSSYYSFDRGGYHFIVLNAAYGTNGLPSNWHQGYIPDFEADWLISDLAQTDKYTIVFIHHNLDGQAGVDTTYYVRERKRVRHILENSGKVIAVFGGHLHWTYQWVHKGISYFVIERAGTGDVCTYAKIKLWPESNLLEVIIRPVFSKMSFTYGPRPPLAFDLNSPLDGMVVASTQDTLRWRRAKDLDLADSISYTLYYDTDSLFTNPAVVSGIVDTFWAMDPPLPYNTTYYWKVVAEDQYSLSRESLSTYEFATPPDTITSSVFAAKPLDGAFIESYPNPFSSRASLRFYNPVEGASIRIFDVRGRLIATPARNITSTGWGEVRWRGDDSQGMPVSSGVYFGVIEAKGARKTCKLLLVR